MGIFDDIVKGAKEAFSEFSDSLNTASNKADENPHYNNPSPTLQSKMVQVVDFYDNHKFNFMISGDFVEFPGYESSLKAFKYQVNGFYSEDDFTISFHKGAGDFLEITDCIEEYLSTGTVTDVDEFEQATDGKYLFRVKLHSSSYYEYFYVLNNPVESIYDYYILLLFYPDEIVDTALENKLISCISESMKTLTQTN